MAVRQYIGARYVTKIYENSLDPSSAEWEAGVNYENLIIVTYNNGSYMSKKPVPASVGNPPANPAYWTQTGFYNGQIASLTARIDAIEPKVEEPYAPVESGTFIYTGADGNTTCDYVKIDKAYKPRLVLAGENVKEGGVFVTADVGEVSLREKATIAMNASTLHSSLSTCGTIIVDGVVKYTNDINYAEWGTYDLENLYMTEDGALNVVDAFESVANIQALDPVWTFQGWQKIAENGTINDTIRRHVYAPRSIIAQDYDGNYLLMTTGGRRLDNYGMDYDDVVVAIASLNFNARIIYDCDGGGSSSLVVHQIRRNDIIEGHPRAVPNMIVFDVPTVTYSDYESGYSEYLATVRAREPKNNIASRLVRVIGELDALNPTVGIEYYNGVPDGYDKYTYTRLMKFGYDNDRNRVFIDAVRSDNSYLNALNIEDSLDSVEMLGKEVWRATAFNVAEYEVTSNASGIVDSNAIVTGGIPISNNFIISALALSDSYYVIPRIYGSRYTFSVFATSDDSRAANATFTIRVLYANAPKRTAI